MSTKSKRRAKRPKGQGVVAGWSRAKKKHWAIKAKVAQKILDLLHASPTLGVEVRKDLEAEYVRLEGQLGAISGGKGPKPRRKNARGTVHRVVRRGKGAHWADRK